MTNTKACCTTGEATQQIAEQAQTPPVCSLCVGRKVVTHGLPPWRSGPRVTSSQCSRCGDTGLMPFKEIMRRWQDRMEAAFEAFYTITFSGEQGSWGNAADQVAYIRTLFRKMPAISDGTGTVPAGALADWQEKAERLNEVVADGIVDEDLFRALNDLNQLRAHLAAMPAQDVNAELLVALVEAMGQLMTLANETYWTLHALPVTEYGTRPRDLDAGLIAKALMNGERVEKARAAIAQAEKGAAPAVSAAELLAALREAHGLTPDSYHTFKCAKCELIRQAGQGAAG